MAEIDKAFDRLETALREMSAIAGWQTDPSVHPLTCGRDSEHQLLVPIWDGTRVVLRCADCDYRQEHVPDVVKDWHPHESIAAMLAREAEDAERVREAIERGEIPSPPLYRKRPKSDG